MRHSRFRMWLSPVLGGSYTRMRLCGAVPTTLPPKELRRLSAMLSQWSGYPVELVLPVAAEKATWLDLWAEAVKTTPGRHLEVRFAVQRLPKARHGR